MKKAFTHNYIDDLMKAIEAHLKKETLTGTYIGNKTIIIEVVEN